MSKVALITGITGQDGSYLAELLLEKGYEVHGIVRRASLINTHRIDHIYEQIHLHYGDLTDATNIIGVIKKIEPDEIYNLGAQSHVKVSFEIPEYTAQVWMALELSEFLRLFAFLVWRKRLVSIKHLQVNCMVRYRKLRRQKPHLFIHVLHMELLNSMGIGLSKTIVSPMGCIVVLVFFLTMSHQDEVRLL